MLVETNTIGAVVEKCPECGNTKAIERVEIIDEPFEGKLLRYGSRYYFCAPCKTTWYSREQMQQQMFHRTRALNA